MNLLTIADVDGKRGKDLRDVLERNYINEIYSPIMNILTPNFKASYNIQMKNK
jgi:hypothetical protein